MKTKEGISTSVYKLESLKSVTDGSKKECRKLMTPQILEKTKFIFTVGIV